MAQIPLTEEKVLQVAGIDVDELIFRTSEAVQVFYRKVDADGNTISSHGVMLQGDIYSNIRANPDVIQAIDTINTNVAQFIYQIHADPSIVDGEQVIKLR